VWRVSGLVGGGLLLGALLALLGAQAGWLGVGLALVLPVMAGVVVEPRFGVYLIAASVVGQWPWNAPRYLGILVSTATLLWLVRHRRPLFPLNSILVLVGAYTFIVMASAIQPQTRIGIASGIVTQISCLALVWLFVTMIDTPQAVRTAVGVIGVSVLVAAAIGLVQAATHFTWLASTTAIAAQAEYAANETLLDLQGWAGLLRIDSITGTPDHFALYMQTAMPFVFFWLVRQRRAGRRALGVAALGLLAVAHLLSFTRGAMLTTALVVILMVWVHDRRRLLAIGPVAAILVLGALLLWGPARERLVSILTLEVAGTELDTGTWRLQTIPIALEMILERPWLGFGIDQQHHNWPASAQRIVALGVRGAQPPLHNTYLLAAIEVGLVGLGVLLVLLGLTLRRLRSMSAAFAAAGMEDLAGHARATWVAMVGLVVAFAGYPMLGSFRHFWLLLALTGSLMTVHGHLVASRDRPTRPGSVRDVVPRPEASVR
jgi:O-antigen ligase